MITLHVERGLVGRDSGHNRHVGNFSSLQQRPRVGGQKDFLSQIDLDRRDERRETAVHSVLQWRNREMITGTH